MLPLPENENERLKALKSYDILDTIGEKEFDRLTKLASVICDAPISLVSLLDENRQWFKSKVGIDAEQTPREISFCQYAILGNSIFEVEDAAGNELFKDNPLVTEQPKIRFYAGCPLVDPNGYALGTLCVIDREPKKLNENQKIALDILAQEVISQIVSRKERIELKNLQESLRIDQEKYHFIVNNVKEIIFQTDLNTNISFINDSWLETTNYIMEDTMNKSFFEFVHEDDLDKVINFYNSTLENKTISQGIEFRLITLNGSEKWCELFLKVENDLNKNITGTTGTIIDISNQIKTQQKLKEAKDKAEEATRLKSDFLAMMSHEIRTPLNGIIGMTDLLQQEFLPKTYVSQEQKEIIETIKSSGDSLLVIINEILDFSKLEAGKMDIEITSFEINQLIEETLIIFTLKAYEKNLELLYYIEKDVPLIIKTDKTRLKQILINLIGNAIKFTKQGEVFISTNLKSKENEKVIIEFCVRDTGIGISSENIPKLFSPFSQADSSINRKYGGTGLGLAICKKLANLLGGDIRLESKSGIGSSFYFTIEAESKGEMSSNFVNKTIPELKNKNILIVDDNKASSDSLESQLNKWGFNTFIAFDTISALNQVKSESFEVGIISLEGAEKDINLTREIRKIRSINSLPLLLITSRNDYENYKAPYQEIFSCIIFKPLKKSELLGNLFDLLSKTSNKVKPNKKVFNSKVENLSQRYSLRILVAEDNSTNQKLMNYIFEALGFNPDFVINGLEALKALKKNKYDIIFMDIQMPEMDGIETTKIIRKNVSESPVIIALTANAFIEDRDMCLNAGMNDYLSKPVKVEDVSNMIKKWGDFLVNKNKPMEMKFSFSEEKIFESSVLGDIADSIEEDRESFILSNIKDFDIYLENNNSELIKSFEKNDLKSISEIVHTLKGSCLNLGVIRTGEISKALEEKVRQNDLSDLDKLLKLFSESVADFKIEYKKIISK